MRSDVEEVQEEMGEQVQAEEEVDFVWRSVYRNREKIRSIRSIRNRRTIRWLSMGLAQIVSSDSTRKGCGCSFVLRGERTVPNRYHVALWN